MRRIPSFALLRAFEAAARLLGFSAAAAELSLTASAVSHQIAALEAFLGKALFMRHHRRVSLTPEGQRLFESTARILDALEATCSEVSLPASEQVLTVYCAPSFAAKWLGPRMPGFVRAHPTITIRLTSGAEAIDLTQVREVDLAITFGTALQRPGIEVVPLGRERVAPMCTPLLLKKSHDLAAFLSSATLIDSQLNPLTWRDWFTLNRLELPGRARPSFDRAALAIAAAVDGMGIVLESTRLAERELRRRELVVIGDGYFTSTERDVHFFSQRIGISAGNKVTVFRKWLERRLKEDPPPVTAARQRRARKRPLRQR